MSTDCVEARENGWYCPLLGKWIAEGYCLDIYYQRVALFKADVLKTVQRATRLEVGGVSRICKACPNQPLSREDYEQLGVQTAGSGASRTSGNVTK
jgi:hypothetical protein